MPQALFRQNLAAFSYQPVKVDIGFVQTSALRIDLAATTAELEKFLPFQDSLVDELAAACSSSSAILCDIAPLGIAVGKKSGIPSVLIENFTWDWLYTFFSDKNKEIDKHITYLQDLFNSADYRIQTEPLCQPSPNNLRCGPIFRRTKHSSHEIREQLGCKKETNLVVITMGGISQKLPNTDELEKLPDFQFVFTAQAKAKQIGPNIIILSRERQVYHPDLIGAADIVVCKTGYSTVAECCQAGVRVICVGRPEFAESAILQDYMEKNLHAINLHPDKYLSGNWNHILQEALHRPQPTAATDNGADNAADFILQLIT